MEAAPFHAAVADGPEGARPAWLAASDGIRLRAVAWPRPGASGTVLILPGRTEYVEKYAGVAGELARRGFASAALDWRGQGLSDRPAGDPLTGHVDDFAEYQRDLDAFLAQCAAEGLPRPWHMLAHSMGGLIGLRALHRGVTVARAAFSAPMWGLSIAPHRRMLGWGASAIAVAAGMGLRAAPGPGGLADPASAPFDGNLLTGDAETFAWMKRQLAAHPALALRGPSLAWVLAAFREMHALEREPAPAVPCLVLVGTGEAIVSPEAIHARAAAWPGARLAVLDGARHEVLMETPPIRARAWDAIAAHLAG